jgi:hypothetical protein
MQLALDGSLAHNFLCMYMPISVQVLLKFLEVFSAFKWEEYCLSLQGPIPLSSFPYPQGETSSRKQWAAAASWARAKTMLPVQASSVLP